MCVKIGHTLVTCPLVTLFYYKNGQEDAKNKTFPVNTHDMVLRVGYESLYGKALYNEL